VRSRIIGPYRAACIWLCILILPSIASAYDVHLDVPFKSQVPPPSSDKWSVDKKGNKVWPATKNCGQTCVLMISSYYKQTAPTEQDIKTIDDWLFQTFNDPVNDYLGSITSTDKLVKLATDFAGFTDVAKHSDWTLDNLKDELNQGFPVVVAVWTDMSVGGKHEQHFMVLVGMDDDFVYVNDPGKTKGKNNKYSIARFKTAWENQHSAVVTIHSKISGSCTPVPQGLVGWWPGEGNANDLTGSNNGTLVNGATFSLGEVGQAFNLNGVNQYIQIPNQPGLNPTSGITDEVWVKLVMMPPVSITNGWDPMDNNGPASHQGSHLLRILNDGSVAFGILKPGTIDWQLVQTGTGKVTAGSFVHVAGTYDASTGKQCVYVNGNPTCSQFASSVLNATNNTLTLGGDSWNGIYLNGEVDEPAIYNRALSASEIQAIFNAGSAGKCK
jgi:predicted double-glycine peptidase